jgi:hypothetical protein
MYVATTFEKIVLWASHLTAEQKMRMDVMNFDLIMQDYYWTGEFWEFVEGVLEGGSNLVFVVGSQGAGKTSALRAIRSRAETKGVSCYDWRWGEDYEQHWHVVKDFKLLLIDLPDYRAGNSRSMVRDLDEIGRLWYDSRFYSRTIVVSVQREMFGGHYLLGKGAFFNLRPLTPEELVMVYVRKFDSTWPFDRDSLLLVGRLCRGIFRRFLRYIKLCVEDMRLRGADVIGVDDVGRVIDVSVVGRDMELEMSGFMRAGEREQAVAVLLGLLGGGDMNQKELASVIGVSPSSMGRLLGKLELRGYVRRERGDRKELLVRLV